MSGTSSSAANTGQTQTSTTSPYAPAQPALNGLLDTVGRISPNMSPTETAALQGLQGSSGILGNYLPQQQNVASQLYGGGQDYSPMVNDAYQQYMTATNPTAGGDYLDPNKNPFFGNVTSTIGNDVMNRLKAEYAGAGRDPSGAGSYGYNLARGISEGTAPVFANQYNSERQRQMDAISGRYSAGGGTAGLLSGLQQTRFGNMQAGAGAASTAQDIGNSPYVQQLTAAGYPRDLAIKVASAQAGIISPIAAQFGTTTGTSTGTQSGTATMSPAQQFAMISQGAKNILPVAQSGAGLLQGLLYPPRIG